MGTYDDWETTNPDDEFLEPEDEDEDEAAEEEICAAFKALKLSIMEAIEQMIELGYEPPEAERIVFQWCRE